MKDGKKIAVLFPGIGYTCEKPLLYYSGRLAQERGYKVVKIPYGNFPQGVKGDPAKMYQCFISARDQAEEILQGVDWSEYSRILFLSKSVGTAVALSYAMDHRLTVRNVLFTPVEETFKFPAGESISFHGTADPWAETKAVKALCRDKEIPLYITKDANHSLECGDTAEDLKTLRKVLRKVSDFIDGK